MESCRNLIKMTTTSTHPGSSTAAFNSFSIQQFQRLLLDFVDDFQHGRYDTINKLRLIDEVAATYPYLQKEKKTMMERLLQRQVTCRSASLNKYQLYSNVYSSNDFLRVSSNKRKRSEKRLKKSSCKRRKVGSVVVIVRNPASVFYGV